MRNISKALSQSTRKPAAIQGGANLTTTRSTLTINVPAEGLYYITDSAGNPIMIGTKSGNANIMKNDAKDPQWRTLGTAVVFPQARQYLVGDESQHGRRHGGGHPDAQQHSLAYRRGIGAMFLLHALAPSVRRSHAGFPGSGSRTVSLFRLRR